MSESGILLENEQDVETLNSHLLLLKKELFTLRFQKKLGELKNTSKFLVTKKQIARIKTKLAKRKVGE